MQKRGKFIVLDGADGSGKDTQAEQFVETAKKRGLSAALIRFPGYEKTFAGKDVRAYQKGEFGELKAIHPKLASYPYAVDRMEQQDELNALLAQNDVVISARYVPSNIAYQAARVPEAEREAFRTWCAHLDYETLGNPREDAVIFLYLPVELSNQLINARKETGPKHRDIYDENTAYRAAVLKEYEYLCTTQPHWHKLDCDANGQIRSINDIARDIEEYAFSKVLALAEVQ